MEGFKEFQGKDLDDAIGQACSYYDTLREKLEIDIVHDSKSGIFGIVGARKAKIKARRVQLRNAVDSILGRGRGAQPGAAPCAEEDTKASDSANACCASEARTADNGNGDGDARRDVSCRDDASDAGRKPRPARQPRSPRGQESRTGESRPHETRPHETRSHETRQNKAIPEFHNDGTSILSGQVLGESLDPENDEEASYGPGNEIPRDSLEYGARPERADRGDRQPRGDRADRADRQDRGDRNPRAERAGRPERTDRGTRPRPARPPRAPRPPRTEGVPPNGLDSVLAGTLDGDALNEDALSEGLPIVPFDQLDQDRLRALSLEAVGRLVQPIVGDVPLTVELGDSRVNVVLDCGDDSGLLIGREGQTLASLQYLASRLVSRGMGAAVRVQLDAGEYRLRQDEKLRDLALVLAERVRTTGKSHSTRPLSSYHRRIVHMALQEATDVQTRSSGDGALKRVVIQRKRGN